MLIVGVVLLAVVMVALAWWAWASEHRPRHADAGMGALTVAQLYAQMAAELPATDTIVHGDSGQDRPP